jgi:hypothetical protein
LADDGGAVADGAARKNPFISPEDIHRDDVQLHPDGGVAIDAQLLDDRRQLAEALHRPDVVEGGFLTGPL